MSTDTATWDAPALTRSEKVFTITGVMLGLLLAALDQTIVATAGPAIQADLRIDPSLYAWLTTAYLVTSTTLVPIYGKLSDLYGRRRILCFGIIAFVTASVLCGVSQTTAQLIFARALQGVGSAALFTSAFAVIADVFPPRERGRYQGLFGGVFGLASVIGPLAGGFITDHFGWHWVFFINLPLGALALGFIIARMPPFRHHRRASGVRIDVWGALLLLVAVVPLLLALSLGRREVHPGELAFTWDSWPIAALFALSATGIVLFLLVERRVKDPILDLRLFRNRIFALSNAASFVMGTAFLSAIVFLPLFMVNVVGLNNTNSGLTVTPLTLGLVFGNIVSGQLVSRLGRYKRLMLGSFLFLVAGYAVMGFTLTPDSTQAGVTLKMIMVGVGLGPAIPLFTLVTQNAVSMSQVGVATSTVTFFRQLGSTVGVAVFGTVFGVSLAAGIPARVGPVLEKAPPAARALLLQKAAGAGGQVGGDLRKGEGFPAESLKALLVERFEALRQADPSPQARARLEVEARRSLETVDQVHRALKWAFTRSISLIYRFGMGVAALAFLLTLLIPEVPLRTGRGPPPPPEATGNPPEPARSPAGR